MINGSSGLPEWMLRWRHCQLIVKVPCITRHGSTPETLPPVQLETISPNSVIIHSLINFPNQLALQLIKIVYNIMMINFLERAEYLKYHTLE